MLVLAVSPDRTLQMHAFRRIDLTTGRFIGDAIEIEVDNITNEHSLLDPRTPNQINYGVEERVATLAVKSIAPGDYARVEFTSGSLQTNKLTWLCMFRSAPVYRIVGGTTSIIRVDDMTPAVARVPDRMVLAEYQKARVGYPGLGAIAEIVSPTSEIRWEETERGWFMPSRNCAEPASFTVVAD